MEKITTKSGYKIIRICSKQSNSYLITNGRSNLMVDSCYKTHGNEILKKLKEIGIEKIDLLILTHSHHDHAGNAGKLKRALGGNILIDRNEVGNIENGRSPPVNGIKPLTKIFMKLFGNLMMSLLKYPPCKPDIIFNDEYNLDEFGIRGSIIHTPGHTSGSICVIIDDQYIFVGDTLSGASDKGVLPPFALNIDDMIKSWERLLETEGKYYFPGHGDRLNRSRIQKEFSKYKKKYGLDHSI